MAIKNLVSSLLLAGSMVSAHPGHVEKVYQHSALPLERKSLSHCEQQFNDPEFVKRNVEFHAGEFARLRREAGYDLDQAPKLSPRDYISVSKINHKSNKAVSWNMDLKTLFSDYGACMLMPAVDQGPLYVQGEEIRKDIKENEPGIKMTLAVQVVDYKTCQVVPNAYVDIWSSNSTGIYTGVQGYPGMGDPKDAGILKLRAMRGVQPTDANGIASFDSLLPGHYDGRASHIHAIVYTGATKLPNNTITGGKAPHVGQIYFDQSLIAEIDKFKPYSTNKNRVVPNVNDFLFIQGANGDDPIVRYSLVGKSLDEGVFAWIRFGINQQKALNVNPAAWWTADGGKMNPKGPVGQMGGGGGWGGWGKRFLGKKEEEAKQEEEN
ncbi:Intradiol ring-cleavage dioxygenase [Rhypophila decipiens]|uniref:Intradiol ring-cleavage dioxygenase n=1 Tax=Rhypophila decipiens TaxID=261697 RepID=A0AAN6YE83_9PEZI|nr:Intradiol ring-cleavage dioxygenase [Rhypophila decipiens]